MSTVLVVDDDVKFLDAVEQMLTRAGYDVLTAADGNEAVGMLEKQHDQIDLTIVDLALPGINGFEIIGAMSRRPNPIKLIATTAIYHDIQLEMAAALGAHAAIRKPPAGGPLPEGEWLGTVRSLIGDPRRARRANANSSAGPTENPESGHGNESNR